MFGEKALEEAWKQVKQTIQCAHIYKKISKSTVRFADAWASAKWGRNMEYTNILRYVGVEITDD